MRKFICLVLFSCMVMALVSCGSEDGNKNVSESQQEENEKVPEPPKEELDIDLTASIEASELDSFILVDSSNVKKSATKVYAYNTDDVASVYEKDGDYKVTADVIYKSVNVKENEYEALFELLGQYNIEGDITKILESTPEKQYVIIGESISNVGTFDFEVGDTIAIGTKTSEIISVNRDLSGEELLMNQLWAFSYDYTTFEICAVIEDIPTRSLPVYMLDDIYFGVTWCDPYDTSQ